MTPVQFRRAALDRPGVVEGSHHGHPDFRARGRVFASLHPDGVRAMVRVPLPVQKQLVAAHPGVFVPATGAWGRAGCTMLQLDVVSVQVVRDALTEAWQFAEAAANAGTKPRRPRRRS